MDRLGTHHALPPEPVGRRVRLGRLALDAHGLLVARKDDPDRLPRDRVAAGSVHPPQCVPARLVRRALGPQDEQAQADEALAEEDGGEEDDEYEKDRELAVVNVLCEGQGQIWMTLSASWSPGCLCAGIVLDNTHKLRARTPRTCPK